MELLGEMLQVLRDGYTANDTEHVLCILSQLSKSSRFGLSVTFLSVTEKKAVSIKIAFYEFRYCSLPL